MVGQHLDAADVRERADEGTRPPEVVFAVREAGHEDAADPDGRAEFGEVARTVENGRVVRARERAMRVRVEELEVKEHRVRRAQQSLLRGVAAQEAARRRVETRRRARRMRLLEEIGDFGGLQHRLAAGGREAALCAPVRPVAERAGEDLIGRRLEHGRLRPRVGVVAVAAAKRAAAQKGDEPNARPIRRTKGLKRMDFHGLQIPPQPSRQISFTLQTK